MDCSIPGFPVNHQLPDLTQTHVHWAGDAIQPSHPLLSPFPPVFNLSQHQGLFQWVSSLHQVSKYWSFGFSISPSNEYSGSISFRIECHSTFDHQMAEHCHTMMLGISLEGLCFGWQRRSCMCTFEERFISRTLQTLESILFYWYLDGQRSLESYSP